MCEQSFLLVLPASQHLHESCSAPLTVTIGMRAVPSCAWATQPTLDSSDASAFVLKPAVLSVVTLTVTLSCPPDQTLVGWFLRILSIRPALLPVLFQNLVFSIWFTPQLDLPLPLPSLTYHLSRLPWVVSEEATFFVLQMLYTCSVLKVASAHLHMRVLLSYK